MLKNSFKIIAIMLTIILCLFTPFSFADEENSTQLISEQEPSESENTESSNAEETAQQPLEDNSFKKSDVYLTGDDITIDYIVDGNLFICADNVTISSQIGGDAFICANNITISEQGYIFSNLFAISNSLNIEGVVYDIYSCADNITISGYVYRDLKSTSNNLNIFGTIGRNAFVSASNIEFIKYDENASTEENAEQKNILAQGNITGDLNYSSKTELSIPENSVTGNVNYSTITSNLDNDIIDYVISLLTSLALVLIIWLLSLWITPNFLTNAENLLTKKTLPLLGYGILSLILLPIIALVLTILGITSYAGLLLILLYILLLCVSTSIVLITISNLLCKKFNITKKILNFVILMVVSAVLWGLSFIPYLGVILKLACIIFGLGILTKNLLPHKKEKIENN